MQDSLCALCNGIRRDFKMRFFRLFIVFTALLCGLVSVCQAQMSVTPYTIEVKVKRGGVIEGTLTIYNKYKHNAEVTVQSVDFLRKGIEPSIWLNIKPDKFVIEASSVKVVNYIISAPADASGELMAMVFFGIVKEGQKGGVGVQVGIPFYAIVEETISFDVGIEDCAIERKGKKITGFVVVRNDSNIHIRPKTKVILESKGDEFKKDFDVYYGAPVLAGDKKSYMFETNDIEIPYKNVKATVIMDYGTVIQEKKIIRKEFEVEIKDIEEKKGEGEGLLNK